MSKPPASPPSSDLDASDGETGGRDEDPKDMPQAAEGEEHARREGKGRPARSKR